MAFPKLDRHRASAVDVGHVESVIAQLEYVSAVPAGSLRPVLASLWADGDAMIAAARIRDLVNTHARNAARAPRGAKARPADIAPLVKELLRQHPGWTKRKAFGFVAQQRAVDPDTVRNAFYAYAKSHQREL